MKKTILLLVSLLFLLKANAISFQELIQVNPFWTTASFIKINNPAIYSSATEKELIVTHLRLVHEQLSEKTTNHLSKSQKNNRSLALAILKQYYSDNYFPINSFHSKRTPYFVDRKNTACAVGHLIIKTGFAQLANKIKNENNYGHLKDLTLEYPAISYWAKEYGFTINELAWIQPFYGPNPYTCFGSDSVLNIIHPTCNGLNDGSIILPAANSNFYPSNFTPPLNASINPAGNCGNLPGGNYQITVSDAFNNSFVVNATVIDPPPLTSTVNIIQPILCDGDSATVQVSAMGGVGSYGGTGTFQLISGFHNFIISDINGCQSINSTTIPTSPSPVMINSQITQPILCINDSATVSVSATGGYGTFTGIGAFQAGAGTNYFTVTDSIGCQTIDTILISSPTQISSLITANADNGSGNGNAKVVANGGTPPYTYLWSSTQTTDSISGLTSGLYNVQITDSNNCTWNDSIMVPLEFPAGVSSMQKNNFTIYPNPTSNKHCFLKFTSTAERTISISNIMGRIEDKFQCLTTETDLHFEQKGIYIITIQENELRSNIKILVQ